MLVIFALIIAAGDALTLYYYYLRELLLHQNTFAIMAATVVFKLIYDLECPATI